MSKPRYGDCYEAAGMFAVDPMRALLHDDDMVLVHGHVTGQGKIEGVIYGHAWIETGDLVTDTSNGRNICMPVDVYYALGKIDPDKCCRYTPQEATDWVMRTGHWGPWGLDETDDEKRIRGKLPKG